jgi:hypothetical protein
MGTKRGSREKLQLISMLATVHTEECQLHTSKYGTSLIKYI